MLTRLLASVALMAGLSQVAIAQNSPSGQQPTAPVHPEHPAGTAQETHGRRLYGRENCPQFFITAKNKQGEDVMMRVGPNSMTMVTEVPVDNASTTGSGASNNTGSSGQDNNSSPNGNSAPNNNSSNQR
jgi:hypothetical protein